MKIKHTKNKKVLIISACVLLLIGIAAALYFATTGNNSSSDESAVKVEQEKSGADIKKQSLENSETKENGASGSDQPVAPVPQPGGKSKVEVAITAANQTDSMVQIRTLISAIDSQGSCTLTLTGPSGTVKKISATQNFANTSTCQGFDISTSELSKGTWMATIIFESASLQGSAMQNITVN